MYQYFFHLTQCKIILKYRSRGISIRLLQRIDSFAINPLSLSESVRFHSSPLRKSYPIVIGGNRKPIQYENWNSWYCSDMIEAAQLSIYLFKVNNRNTKKGCEICSKLTIKTLERRQWRRCDEFIVNFEHISHFFLVF